MLVAPSPNLYEQGWCSVIIKASASTTSIAGRNDTPCTPLPGMYVSPWPTHGIRSDDLWFAGEPTRHRLAAHTQAATILLELDLPDGLSSRRDIRAMPQEGHAL